MFCHNGSCRCFEMTGACILIFGVSGVGKSRACSDYVDRNPDWLHLRAGELLSRLTGESPENLRTALDEEVVANQALLSLAVTRARAGREHRPVLVDCHAVIDNDDDLVVVPAGTVVALAPDGIILLEHDAAEVSMRRIIDLRVRPSREPAAIAREAVLERDTVEGYAASLTLPLVIARTEVGFRLDASVDAVLSRRLP